MRGGAAEALPKTLNDLSDKLKNSTLYRVLYDLVVFEYTICIHGKYIVLTNNGFCDILYIERGDSMSQTLINIRMDEELKRSFDNVCNELGMNMTTAITIFAKKMVRENRVPFEVSIDPFYSEKNLKSLSESKNQLENGITIVKTLEELKAMEDE